MGSPSRRDEYAQFRAVLQAHDYPEARRLAAKLVEIDLIDRLKLVRLAGQEDPDGFLALKMEWLMQALKEKAVTGEDAMLWVMPHLDKIGEGSREDGEELEELIRWSREAGWTREPSPGERGAE